MIGPVSAFTMTQIAIAGDEKHPAATELRLVSPGVRETIGGTDLQARFENKDGKGYWVTLLTIPERVMPPFPDRRGFEWR